MKPLKLFLIALILMIGAMELAASGTVGVVKLSSTGNLAAVVEKLKAALKR